MGSKVWNCWANHRPPLPNLQPIQWTCCHPEGFVGNAKLIQYADKEVAQGDCAWLESKVLSVVEISSDEQGR
jgi:hypothetical protein